MSTEQPSTPVRRGGRPPIGGKLGPAMVGEDLRREVDQWRAEHDLGVAEALRVLLRAGLDAQQR